MKSVLFSQSVGGWGVWSVNCLQSCHSTFRELDKEAYFDDEIRNELLARDEVKNNLVLGKREKKNKNSKQKIICRNEKNKSKLIKGANKLLF